MKREQVKVGGEVVIPAWEEEPLSNRLSKCRFMLRMHGLMSESEAVRVAERIVKLTARERGER